MLGLLGTAPVFAARCPWGCFGQMPAAQEPARMCSFVLCPTHDVACSSSAVGAGRVHRRSLCSAAVRVTSSLTLKTPPDPWAAALCIGPLAHPLSLGCQERQHPGPFRCDLREVVREAVICQVAASQGAARSDRLAWLRKLNGTCLQEQLKWRTGRVLSRKLLEIETPLLPLA